MAGTEPSAIGRVLTDLVEMIAEVDDSLQAINDANAEYSRRWRQVNEALGVIPLDNPLAEFPTLWDWYSRCQGDLDTGDARYQFLESLSARALQTSGVLSVAPPAYTIEMFEHDGNPDDVPYTRWFLTELSRPKQLAAQSARGQGRRRTHPRLPRVRDHRHRVGRQSPRRRVRASDQAHRDRDGGVVAQPLR